MISVKIEQKYPQLAEKITQYREHKKGVNRNSYIFKLSKNEQDRISCQEHLAQENRLLNEIKHNILEIIRSEKVTNRNVFQYWLERKERVISL